jgi:hypothetical protein
MIIEKTLCKARTLFDGMLIAMLQIKIQNKISTEASYLPNIVNSTQEALIVTSYQGLTIGISSP